MIMNDMKNLCLNFVKAESEKKVIDILKKAKYWDNEKNWKLIKKMF